MSVPPTLQARLDEVARRHPDRASLIVGDEVLTHAEVEQLSKLVARALVEVGFGRRSRVAVLSPNHLLGMVATLGIVRSGATWIPLNPRDSIDSMAELCRRFRVDMLIHHPGFAEAVDPIRAVAPDLSTTVPLVTTHEEDDLLAWAAANDRGAELAEPGLDDLVAVFATGGTTGVPKGVCYSYRTLSAIAGNFVEILDHVDPVFLAAAPLTHVSGRVCLGVMAAGGTTVVLPRFDPAAVLSTVEERRVTTMMLPTTLLTRLLAHPAAETTDTSSLTRVWVGASPVPVEVIKRAIAVLGPVVTHNYGQTEAPMLVATMHPEDYFVDADIEAGVLRSDERVACCGRPSRFCRVRLIGSDAADVATGEVGEIVVQGEFVMDGYLDDEAATEAATIDGWHRTGDLGTFDDEGYLRIVGRLKDLIITGGFNVYPAEIEAVIAERPDVHESAVVGLPDTDWGERVVAAVEPAEGGGCDIDGLLAHVRSRLGAVKTPKEVVIVDELPRNANGKILKLDLVEELASREGSTPA